MNVLVTGGSKSVERATALRFARPNVNVFINYHSDDGSARNIAEVIPT